MTKNIKKEKYKKYRIITGTLGIIFSLLIIVAGLHSVGLLIVGILGMIGSIFELISNKKYSYYMISSIFLIMSGLLNMFFVGTVSFYGVYVLVIGIFNMKFSKES